MRISEIKNVCAFGRLVVALSDLGPKRIASECDPICLDDSSLAEEFERAFFLKDHNVVGVQNRLRSRLRSHGEKEQTHGQRGKYSGTHSRIIAGSHARNATLLG